MSIKFKFKRLLLLSLKEQQHSEDDCGDIGNIHFANRPIK